MGISTFLLKKCQIGLDYFMPKYYNILGINCDLIIYGGLIYEHNDTDVSGQEN